jgi:phosphatidylglycerophosphate synthase
MNPGKFGWLYGTGMWYKFRREILGKGLAIGMERQGETIGKIAIILAPDDKGLRAVFGIPAVRRLSLLTFQLGLTEIHVVGQVQALQPVLSDLVPPKRFHPVEEPAFLSRVIGELALPEQLRILVLKANHVTDRRSLIRLLEVGDSPDLHFMEASGKRGTERLYWTTPPHLVSILAQLWSPSSHLSDLDNARPVQGLDGFPAVLEGGEEQAKIVEGKLMEAQASQTKGEDGFLARHVNRRISRFISKRLVLTRVTPNQITLAGASMGLIGAFLLSWVGYWPKLIGSLLFLFCIIVDGVDGEIARLKLKATSFGHYLDVVTDNLVHIAIFLGIALGLYRDSGDSGYLRILWILIGGFGLCGLAVYQCILRRSPEELRRSVKTIRIMAMVSNRDFAYIVVVLALVQRLQWFLIGAAAGTYLFAATLWLTSFYEKRTIAK